MRIQEIRDEIRCLDRRSLQLWFAVGMTMSGVTCGFIWLVLPGLLRRAGSVHAALLRHPEALFGVITLVLLFNHYMLARQKVLHRGRDELVRELVRAEAEEMLALLDPVTELFNRRFLDRILPREVSHADRHASPFAIAIFDIADFGPLNQRLGNMVGDGILVEVARLITKTLRPSDLVVRYGADEFLVLMPSTDETAAGRAVGRLMARVEAWNQKHATTDFRLRLDFGLAVYARDADVARVLTAAEQRLLASRIQAPAAEGGSSPPHSESLEPIPAANEPPFVGKR